METKSAVTALSALAHPGRLAIFRLLVRAGPEGIAAGEIARRQDVPPSTLSANLTLLAHAGLIESRRDGKSVIYTVRYGNMAELLEFLIEDCCSGSSEICGSLTNILIKSDCGAKAMKQ